MPPKSSRRVKSQPVNYNNGEGSASAAGFGSNDASGGRRSTPRGKGKAKPAEFASRIAVPEVYKEMLAEALPTQASMSERPLKRRRTGKRDSLEVAVTQKDETNHDVDVEQDEDLEFEDVGLHHSEASLPSLEKKQQTAYRDSDDESDDEGSEWDGVEFGKLPTEEGTSGDLELTLNTNTSPTEATPFRRRVVSKEEKTTRLELHRMHVLCLLSHVAQRNTWCNDSEIHKTLKSLLDKKVLADLHPKADLSQFAKTEFLKRGLEKVNRVWKANFNITARGQRRALWADEDQDLTNVCIFLKNPVICFHLTADTFLLVVSTSCQTTLRSSLEKMISSMLPKI
jgi:xeroderma pigmentosum group C-complementing protein